MLQCSCLMLIRVHPVMFSIVNIVMSSYCDSFHLATLAITVNFEETMYSVTEGGEVVLVIVTDREADRDIMVDLDLFDLSAVCK